MELDIALMLDRKLRSDQFDELVSGIWVMPRSMRGRLNLRVRMDERMAAIVEEAKTILQAAYGSRLARVVLFGSRARGEADPESDLDLLIVLHGDVSPSVEISRISEPISELSLRHDVVVSTAFVSEERFGTGRSPFLMNIRRDGVVA